MPLPDLDLHHRVTVNDLQVGDLIWVPRLGVEGWVEHLSPAMSADRVVDLRLLDSTDVIPVLIGEGDEIRRPAVRGRLVASSGVPEGTVCAVLLGVARERDGEFFLDTGALTLTLGPAEDRTRAVLDFVRTPRLLSDVVTRAARLGAEHLVIPGRTLVTWRTASPGLRPAWALARSLRGLTARLDPGGEPVYALTSLREHLNDPAPRALADFARRRARTDLSTREEIAADLLAGLDDTLGRGVHLTELR